jgi:hypothetical protein
MSLGQVLVLADEDDGRNPKLLRLVLLQSLANDLRLADVSARCVGKGVAANENVTPALSSSSRARSSSSSVRGAATALPVQLEISAVRRLFASPRGRKSLIVADVMCSIRQDVPVPQGLLHSPHVAATRQQQQCPQLDLCSTRQSSFLNGAFRTGGAHKVRRNVSTGAVRPKHADR